MSVNESSSCKKTRGIRKSVSEGGRKTRLAVSSGALRISFSKPRGRRKMSDNGMTVFQPSPCNSIVTEFGLDNRLNQCSWAGVQREVQRRTASVVRDNAWLIEVDVSHNLQRSVVVTKSSTCDNTSGGSSCNMGAYWRWGFSSSAAQKKKKFSGLPERNSAPEYGG